MEMVFADACYWIALINPKDDLHETAMAASQSLGARQIVTSEMVLVEFLNGLSKYGDATRKAAVAMIAELRKNPRVEVIPQTSVLFQAAVAHYAQRLDQQWGATDCSSWTKRLRRGF